MIIFWKGWGFWVFFGTFAWIFIGIGVMIARGTYEPDPAKSARYVDLLFAISFGLSAVTVFLLSWYRARRPRQVTDPQTGEVHAVPHDDAFMFVRMQYWTYVLAAAAVGLTVRALLR
jgi:hypothetical protein